MSTFISLGSIEFSKFVTILGFLPSTYGVLESCMRDTCCVPSFFFGRVCFRRNLRAPPPPQCLTPPQKYGLIKYVIVNHHHPLISTGYFLGNFTWHGGGDALRFPCWSQVLQQQLGEACHRVAHSAEASRSEVNTGKKGPERC